MNMDSSKINIPQYCKIIAATGINHNGRLSLALEMIKESKKAGFDAVKF